MDKESVSSSAIGRLAANYHELSAVGCPLQAPLLYLVLRGQYSHSGPRGGAYNGLCSPNNSG
jgi:hypothetical protein